MTLLFNSFKTTELPINDIIIGERFRKQFGGLWSLKSSISEKRIK